MFKLPLKTTITISKSCLKGLEIGIIEQKLRIGMVLNSI